MTLHKEQILMAVEDPSKVRVRDPQSPRASGAPTETFDRVLATADRVAAELRSTAAARDLANQPPRAEIELLRKNDLLQVQEPASYGGAGLNYAQASVVTRRIARGDTSIAHLLGYHPVARAAARATPSAQSQHRCDDSSARRRRTATGTTHAVILGG